MKRQFDNKFDELFNEKFKNFEVNPPENILNNIKNSVGEQSILQKSGNFIQNKRLWIGISVIVPTIIIGMYSLNPNLNSKNNISNNTSITSTPKIEKIVSENKTTNNANSLTPSNPVNKENTHQRKSSSFETETCGLNFNLNASNSSGKWICNSNDVQFSSTIDPKANVKVPAEGDYTFVWRTSDNSSEENFNIKFNKTPVLFKAKDTLVCGNEIDLKTNIKAQNGSWNLIKGVFYTDINSSKAHVNYNGTGNLHFIWTENSKCSVKDTFKVMFAEKPDSRIEMTTASCFGSPVTLSAKDKNLAKYEWNLNGGISADNSKNQLSVSWAEGIKHDVTLKTWNKYNCSAVSTALVEMPAPIEVGISVTPASCADNGSAPVLPLNKNTSYKYFWMNENIASSNSRNNLFPGTYNLVVADNKNCSQKYSVNISGGGAIKADFYHSQYELNPPSTVYFINTTSIEKAIYKNAEDLKFEWDFGDGQKSDEESPKHLYENSGSYKVKLSVTNKAGCTDLFIVNDININPASTSATNIFSPNGDGQNDVFKVQSAGLKNFHAIITTSKGEKIYEWSDPDGGWDGKIKGGSPATPGIYFYNVNGTSRDDKPYVSNGPVQLVRD